MSDEWSYLEQLLYTLDEFPTSDGFFVKHYDSRTDGLAGSWQVRLCVDGLAGKLPPASWLHMGSRGWYTSEDHRAQKGSHYFDTCEEAFEELKTQLRAKDAARRLGNG